MSSNGHNPGEKRRFRFRLRTLLVVMVLLSIVFALAVQPLAEDWQQRQILGQASELGARLEIGSSVSRDFSPGRFLLSLYDSRYDRYYLHRLDFAGTKVTDDDLQDLAQLRHIEYLNLAGTRVTDQTLTIVKAMPYLETLDLSGTRVTDEAIVQLADIERLSSLRVTNTEVTYDALEELDARLPYAYFCEERAVEELEAAGFSIHSIPHFIEIIDYPVRVDTIQAGEEAFSFRANTGTTLSAQHVQRLNHLRSLKEVNIRDTSMGPEGLSALRQLPELKQLSIGFVNLTDTDLEALARQRQLEKLVIYGCEGISDDGVGHLAALTNLNQVHISDCPGVSDEAVVRLLDTLPNVKRKPRFR